MCRTDQLAIRYPYPKPIIITVTETHSFPDPAPDCISNYKANDITIIGTITWSIHGADSFSSGGRYCAVR